MNTVTSRLAPLVLCLGALLVPPVVAIAQAPAAPASPAAVPELTATQWREDVRFMAAEMKRRHPNLYHTVRPEAFAAAIADLDARIPRLQRNEIIVGMMRIAAMVGDGHSRIDPRKDARFGFPSLPLKLYLFEDGLYVRAAAAGHEALVGARVEAIGGVPVDTAIRRAAELASRDNEMGPQLFVPLYLAMPDILNALNLSSRRDAATLRLSRDGRLWTATVTAGEVDPLWPSDTDISLVTPDGWVDARRTPQPPLWLQAPLDYHRLVELPGRRALYVQLNMVTDIRDQTLADFGRRIAERVAATNPRALVLDLRLNQGGNGELRNTFVRELIRSEDEDTRLIVLTGRGTFSASQFILDDLDRLTDAVFVGEPASSRPSHYGDAYRTTLPNSGISVRTSIWWWQAGQNRDPWTWIDVAVPLTFADYAAGRDPVLETALDFTPRPTLREQLLAAAANQETGGVLRAAEAFRADPANRFANLPRQLVLAAGSLYDEGHRDEAFALAQAAARDFPTYIHAALVLAQLAELTGRSEIALHEAKRVLELDPNNRNVRSLLERLQHEDR